MDIASWAIIIGLLLVSVALLATSIKSLPLSPAMLYLTIGYAIGTQIEHGDADFLKHSKTLEHLTELGVIISLFAAGLKLRNPLKDGKWKIPVRLVLISMPITIGLLTLFANQYLALSWGAALLLGSILAPTDPVLASDVQVNHAWDCDELRWSLTGEAGLNDGAAFPFVMLGLGILGLGELGEFGGRWLRVDVCWAIFGGISIGLLLGVLVAKLVLHLRKRRKEATGPDEFLALGLIALSYGVALAVHAYGFLAVFAAGIALRYVEAHATRATSKDALDDLVKAADERELAADPIKSSAQMANEVLTINEQFERLSEVALVLLVGALLAHVPFRSESMWFCFGLIFIIRPVSVFIGLFGVKHFHFERILTGWFGIRGLGSLYYLMYVINRGIAPDLARDMAHIVLWTVAISIALHGISVTPLMNIYKKRRS